MPIRSQDIDPVIALAIRERMAQITSAQGGVDPGETRLRSEAISKWRDTLRRNSYHFWAAAACFVGGFAFVPLLAPSGPGLTVTALIAMQALAAGLIHRGMRKTHGQLTEFANPEVMRTAGEWIALSPAEKLYCEGVASLSDAERTLTEAARGEILAQLHDLLSSYRKLDGPVRQSLAARAGALRAQSIEGLEQELAELVRRRDAGADAVACATMDQSISLCSQRLSDARVLAPAQEQAEAQQELILQSLAFVHASLSRMAVANSVTLQADVGALQSTVTQVNQQTRAVEDAVNEVLALRG